MTRKVKSYIICFMNIGNLKIGGYAALAPMAGVADRAMRELCIKYGAGYCVGELTSAKGVSLGDSKSQALLCCTQKEKPMASQLFGSDPKTMAEAAQSAALLNPDFIDINMGCPAPKVAGNGGGSALMKDPVLAGKIVKAVVDAVDLPVTVKIRTGWDENSINATEVALRAQEGGAAAVTVHGRTRNQMYAPPVNIKAIADVKKALSIPVIANGDIIDGESAKAMYEQTGCDYIMIGRAAMGNPFIFDDINRFFEGKELVSRSLEERLEVLKEHILLMLEYKGERTAFLEARKHTAWYLKGVRGAANLRKLCGEIRNMDDIEKICEKALAANLSI